MRTIYKNITNSIAFIPGTVAFAFLVLSFFMVQFDFSDAGKEIKSSAHWLTLKDASTARTIISTITGGIISLTVFSFSMVMILLNQAASQMSNRILDKLIGNRFQQTILGFYIGTIVYALFLLSTIRDINSGIYVPAISTYFLIALTVVDIFLFIYFLHYVTQSVKYDTIIHRIYDATCNSLKENCVSEDISDHSFSVNDYLPINAYKSGIFQGFLRDSMLRICEKEDIIIAFNYPVGTFVIQDTPLMKVNRDDISEDLLNEINSLIDIHRGQNIDSSYHYGFRQLMEVAIRALSPGINDPGTAVLSLQSLSQLLAFRLKNNPSNQIKGDNGWVRIITKERSFTDLFNEYIYPIWDYGKDDRLLISEMHHILTQLQELHDTKAIRELLAVVKEAKIKKGI
ncbi:DUF2254 domain-containing protein [Chryseobacterium echinoideorum]|uniref:DUF2254 domain-containing protein n=1 Tax=Chryseobacterium echinoideorum TaxID=1549648 RepID=UPI001E4F85AF|nr:DUF2254 family protein [Chryseobacterium echinoideorum]